VGVNWIQLVPPPTVRRSQVVAAHDVVRARVEAEPGAVAKNLAPPLAHVAVGRQAVAYHDGVVASLLMFACFVFVFLTLLLRGVREWRG
jgi:hypothetical protein